MLKVFLLRHGETQYNADGNKYCGLTDISLTDLGFHQASLVNSQLKGIEFDAVYSSPLKRARLTAELATAKEVLTDSRLIEMDFGLWEGKTKEQFIPENEQLWNNWLTNPAVTQAGDTGENANQVIQRMDDFFHEMILRHPSGKIVVVAHNGVNRLYLAHKLGMPLANYRRLAIENSCLCEFSLSDDGELTLHKLNSRG
ncbi:MAG: histidine phosphatase family protein [Sphingobacteriales bacterium]|nr:MAG: histidine phosphatase family protein [Sphingobacteriales bacterium]